MLIQLQTRVADVLRKRVALIVPTLILCVVICGTYLIDTDSSRTEQAVCKLQAKIALKKAIQRAQVGDIFGARRNAEEARQFDSSFGTLHVSSGELAKVVSEIASYTQLLSQDACDQDALRARAERYDELYEHRLELKDLNTLVGINPDDSQSLSERAFTRMRLHDAAGSLRDAQEVVRLRPDFISSYQLRACAEANVGHQQLAIADYSRVLDACGDDSLIQADRSRARWRSGDTIGALADYAVCIKTTRCIDLFYAPWR